MTVSATAYFADVAPEFATNDPAQVARFIAYAAEDVNATVFGAKANRAIALLAAHMLKLATRGGDQVGSIASQKWGDVEVKYEVPRLRKVSSEYFASTSYGVEFLRLRASVYRGPLTT